MLKDCLKSWDRSLDSIYSIEDQLIENEFGKLLDNNITFASGA